MTKSYFKGAGQKVTFHAPCHLCRSLGVTEAPRQLIRVTGVTFKAAREEQTCCGFGGTYSMKFPEISARILNKKLDDAAGTGAEILVTECPGCVMQLRGGAKQRQERFEVLHLSEFCRSFWRNFQQKGQHNFINRHESFVQSR